MSRDTSSTEAAVLTACRFSEVAGMTRMTWMKNHTVIGVAFHLPVMVLRRDERFGHHTLIEQEIWQNYNAGDPKVMDSRHPRPCRWQKDALAYRE